MRKFKFLIFIMFMVFAFSFPALADINKEFTFAWEQNVDDLPQMKEWRMYWSDAAGGPYTAVLDTDGNPIIIPYDPLDPDGIYDSTQIMIVPGTPGTTVTKYFVLTAVDQSDNESDYSAEAIDDSTGNGWVEIRIPLGRPFSLHIIMQ